MPADPLSAIRGVPLALLDGRAGQLADCLDPSGERARSLPEPASAAGRLLAGQRFAGLQSSAAAGATRRDVAGLPVAQVGAVAVLPFAGLVVQRPNVFTYYGMATSTEQFVAAHRQLVADPSVRAVVWDFNSPGGTVAGTHEAARDLLALRGQKKTVAVADPLMASAAYWLACTADEVVATPSATLGMIGIFSLHADVSGMLDQAGVKVTAIFAGEKKADRMDHAPLSDRARDDWQQQVDDSYAAFVKDVAAGRKTTPAAVRSGYGQGGVLGSARAVSAGLADRVATLAEVVARLTGRASTATSSTAAAVDPAHAARLARQAAANASLADPRHADRMARHRAALDSLGG